MEIEKHQSKKKGSYSGYQIPWIEKFRPQTLADVVGNEETVSRLQAISEDGNLPNLILCGPPGTGKARKILDGGETINNRSLNLLSFPFFPFFDVIFFSDDFCSRIGSTTLGKRV